MVEQVGIANGINTGLARFILLHQQIFLGSSRTPRRSRELILFRCIRHCPIRFTPLECKSIWHCNNFPNSDPEHGTQWTWTDQGLGIEEIASKVVICPPGSNGKPVVGGDDCATFFISNPGTPPADRRPDYTYPIIHTVFTRLGLSYSFNHSSTHKFYRWQSAIGIFQ